MRRSHSTSGTLSPIIRTNSIRTLSKSSVSESESLSPGLMESDILRKKLREAELAWDDQARVLEKIQALHETLLLQYTELEERLSLNTRDAEMKDDMIQSLSQKLKSVELQLDQDSKRQNFHERQKAFNKNHEEMIETIENLRSLQDSCGNKPDLSSNARDADFQHDVVFTSQPTKLQMIVRAKEHQIERLEAVVEELNHKLSQTTLSGSPQILEFERQINDLVCKNNGLEEDINGYQTLLHNKTINGEFGQSEFMRSTSSSVGYHSMLDVRGKVKHVSLASELGDGEDIHDIERVSRTELETEVLKLQDSNKALTLYINTIVSRMLNTEGFEQLLAKDPGDIQPVPASQRKHAKENVDTSQTTFLEKTKSTLLRRSQPSQGKSWFGTATGTSEKTNSFSQSTTTSTGPSDTNSIDSEAPLARRIIPRRSRSPLKTVHQLSKGLRPLASGVAADHISAKEARRLSSQFAPIKSPGLSGDADTPGPVQRKGNESSWGGWFGNKSKQSEFQEQAQHASTVKPTIDSASSVPLSSGEQEPLSMKDTNSDFKHEP